MRGEFQSYEPRQSKKLRRCDWCPDPVAVGDTYLHWFGLSEDHPMVFNSHPECHEAIEREGHESDWDAVTWGEFHQRGKTYEQTHGRRYE